MDAESEEPMEVEYDPADVQLLDAATRGDLEACKSLIDQNGADPCFQVLDTGVSVLMAAAGTGHKEVVMYLIQEGAPWNAVDRAYLCAGDYAAQNGHQECVDILLNHAVTSELILGSVIDKNLEEETEDDLRDSFIESCKRPRLENENKNEPPTPLNAAYLSSRLEYSKDGTRLTDKTTELAVMMDWEKPLMREHAQFICHSDRQDASNIKVLNVGFGMGIVDTEIQGCHPQTHVIIEAHDQVLKQISDSKFDQKPGVRIVKGRWQDAVKLLAAEIESGSQPPFDGIFFDTYAEDDRDLRQFHAWLPKLLTPKTGRYSYYNGLCPDNVFFHGVACETFRLQLKRLGLECEFKPIPVDVSDPSIWKDLDSRYWYFDTYFLPKCQFNQE
ncbi:Arginine N-methyltransferase 2 [Cichlidogyrus casuarinus]|uniref:Arginine N-methyltransferase 2 n=1 Tax=Cichlidogyrus casuarinus TaxID=1844966 RepID=A0ABD2QRH2_9PLAT